MENTDSLTQFFYNIVPGLLFLLGLKYLLNLNSYGCLNVRDLVDGNNTVLVIAYLSFSLLVGFTLQGFTKFVRSNSCLDRTSVEAVVKNNNHIFKKSESFLKANKLLDNKSAQGEINTFYIMHNYLEAKKKGQLPKFFSLRLAFWSNIFFGSLALLLLAMFFPEKKALFITFIILTLFYSFWLFKKYLYILYDTILKSFISAIIINNK